MNITEKVLAAHCGKERVVPGEMIVAKLDGVLANDVTCPIALREMKEMGYETVFDVNKAYFVMDHFTPNANVKAAEQSKYVRDFAKQENMPFFFDVGTMGIEHALLPEKGLVLPGEVIVGGDSHTCTYGALGAFSTGMGSTDIAAALATGELWFKVPETIKFIYSGKLPEYITGKDLILHTIGKIGVDGALYKTMEFTGEAINELSMDGRFTMCNMAIEAGAKNGIIAPDDKTIKYVEEHNHSLKEFNVYYSDDDATYSQIIEIDVSALEPVVACPHLPENTKFVSEISEKYVDQVVIGSCTNGRIEDLRAAASVLKGKKIHKNVRTIIIPATQSIYTQAIKEGLVDIFIEAGAAVSTPTCGPCFGGHMGILAKGEVAVSTTNRNFVGRMGHPESEVFLSSPYVAAATAVMGKISHPREVK
ncbi:3-isopropylmalate dehydratase large subunit [Youngiibacter multivorans]|uniref:3-isopropylmalate dehydratase large subunit n=1 Tax=Youngiibacter multivorans TaxID=937251 RepID=A0ABS4G0X5_9CLOT|nr:3-isopropylmalate dehydratase large subunit [Youngiibacter multivorans]MBP1918195.1 3-isopropylmalate/(R)-2-methylmalate dehydratase large subunit [Youngiibacter multivorans]